MSGTNNCSTSRNHVELGSQNAALSYDINSLIDDDFEVIGSLSDALRSVSTGNATHVPSYDIQFSSHNPSNRAVSGNPDEAGDRTPLANNSINIGLTDNIDRSNTEILVQSIAKSSIATNNDTILITEQDPVSTVQSIRADYQAAQKLMQQENQLLREACENEKQQIEILRRDLEEQKLQYEEKLKEVEQALAESRIKFDEAVASRIERDDIIKMQQLTIQQLQNGNLSCLPASVINEQALVSSLHEKEQLIEALNKQLEEAEHRFSQEHGKVLDLEEIVKILHEYVQNDQQAQAESAQQQLQSASNNSSSTVLLTR